MRMIITVVNIVFMMLVWSSLSLSWCSSWDGRIIKYQRLVFVPMFLRGNAYCANIWLWYGFPRKAWELERIGTSITSASLTSTDYQGIKCW